MSGLERQGEMHRLLGEMEGCLTKLKEVLTQRDPELDRLMENDSENEHLLIARERKIAAQNIDDALEGHGLGFTLLTLATLCERKSDHLNDKDWRRIGRELRRMGDQIPEDRD